MKKPNPKLPAKPALKKTSPARIAALKTLPYTAYLQTPEWKATRRRAIVRADGRCQVCNSKELLNAHHRTYERIGEEKNNDLVVLCGGPTGCHTLFHRHRKLKH